MATVTTPERTAEAEGDQLVVLGGLDWEGYSTVLNLKGDRRYPRLVYLDGSLSIMSPSYIHEGLNRRLGRILWALFEELEIPFLATGATTFRHKPKEGGVEGDDTYYLKNRHRIRGKRDIDLRFDPPPDLAIEIVATHPADDALEVYSRLGVPEVWVCTKRELVFLTLGDDGTYMTVEASQAIPCVSAPEIHGWVVKEGDEDDMNWSKDLRRWVVEVVIPRRRGFEK